MTIELSSYLLPKFSTVSFTIELIPLIISNGTVLNFGKIYKDIIFDQCPKLHLGLDALSNQRILKGVYCTGKTVWLCKLQGWVSQKINFLCNCTSLYFVVVEIYNFAYKTIWKCLHWGLFKLVIHKVLPTNCYIQNISIHPV